MNTLKKLDEMMKHDQWSEWVDQGFMAIGIDKDLRDKLDPVVKKAESLLPKKGIQPATSGVEANQEQTGFAFQSDFNPFLIIAGLATIGLIVYMARK